MDTTPTRTPAEQLRAAVLALTCDHSHPVQPPHGPCSRCGTPWNVATQDISPPLKAELARWLDAHAFEIREDGPISEDLRQALATARAILGGA